MLGENSLETVSFRRGGHKTSELELLGETSKILKQKLSFLLEIW